MQKSFKDEGLGGKEALKAMRCKVQRLQLVVQYMLIKFIVTCGLNSQVPESLVPLVAITSFLWQTSASFLQLKHDITRGDAN